MKKYYTYPLFPHLPSQKLPPPHTHKSMLFFDDSLVSVTIALCAREWYHPREIGKQTSGYSTPKNERMILSFPDATNF